MSESRQETYVRSFDMQLGDFDGRTVDARVVPYNVPATVSDPPSFEPYQEEFLPGVFREQLSTHGRNLVPLNFEHEQGLRGLVGHSLGFDDRSDGLHASFGLLPRNSDSDKALEMLRTGFLSGLSVEFRPTKRGGSRRVGGVVQRVKANLTAVSLCRYPAYAGAEVLALREQPEDLEPVAPRLPQFDRNGSVDELLAAVEFAPLVRAGISDRPWDSDPGRFSDEQYQRSALIRRDGDGPLHERCLLLVLEPDGALNLAALARATAALAGSSRAPLTGVTRQQKAAAARQLIRYCNEAKREVPSSLRQLALS